MSLHINVKTAEDKGERILVHYGREEVEQLDYQPNETSSYDDDVERMSVHAFHNQ